MSSSTYLLQILASIEEADPLDDQLIKELYDNSNSTEEENHRDGKVLNLQDILDTVNPFSPGKSQNQIPIPGQQPIRKLAPSQQQHQQHQQQQQQHPHQLPHPGQHKLGKLQHSEQILPGKSHTGQILPGQPPVSVTSLWPSIKQAQFFYNS